MGYALLAAAVVVLAALCVYLWVRERRAQDSVERLEAMMAQALESDERSRREIAESLHDQALQTLLAANQDLLEAAPGREGVTRAHEIVSATIAETGWTYYRVVTIPSIVGRITSAFIWTTAIAIAAMMLIAIEPHQPKK